ncbi:hypothetical protein [Saccharothrix texasensis]|uniref:Uncharacterized protein n=1 Tax=Saccharothrix texasensis TaxID=103734 RepID=A0A3N1HER3_9PSEU|nr:hypothetical protein [Saccharothrix texasensis]ROP40976.1 hypothetical protein EDD40_6395 [Saccharothrix texasensis]
MTRLLVLVAAVLAAGLTAPTAQAQAPWTLTAAQRQAYLTHYAPVILKRGDENDGKQGRDWLANFDFDRDGAYATNRANWRQVPQYAAGAAGYERWRIRPTLYTALLEFTENGGKSLVLLYHVYNAADKDGDEIHDWERVEIVVRGVAGTPGGAGESFGNATVTHHKDHVMRRSYDPDVNFLQTSTGRHLLLWQADESDFDLPGAGPHAHELRFVTDTWASVSGRMAAAGNAEVRISGADDRRNVHYAFVPEGAAGAVAAFGAVPLTFANASAQASRVDNGTKVTWPKVKRLTYELQDLADVVPTHWSQSAWQRHWLAADVVDVRFETPALGIGTGVQRFYNRSRDDAASDLTDGREGYLSKAWFFGAYSAELDEDTPSGSDDFGGFAGTGLDSSGRSRGAVSGDPASHGAYWRQHEYFVHSGGIDDSTSREVGVWLPPGWQLAANGGFDGRWQPLFDDRPDA